MLLGLLAGGLLRGDKDTGGLAPELVLANTSGEEFRLSEERGSPLLLYFSFPG